MLYELALTPELFNKDKLKSRSFELVVLDTAFKEILKNGILANLDNENWIIDVKARLDKLEPSVRDKFIQLLNHLKDHKRIVTYPSNEIKPIDDFGWLKHTLKTHEMTPFYSIISSLDDKDFKDSRLILLENLFDTPLWSERKEEIDLFQRESDYKLNLSPILRHARTVHLIDPYMSLESRFFKTLELCIELLQKKSVRIHIHCSLPFDYKQELKFNDRVKAYLKEWEGKIKQLIAENNSRSDIFRVCLWTRIKEQQKFHDRSIITDQCGIGIEGGLDVYNYSTKTTWHLLQPETIKRRRDDVTKGLSPYRFLGEKQIK
ncbi:hypothetical protein QC477_005140 [Bacillus cereus]|uniref:hypothetical protein n=1 Tax=Bacillus cereus TaxID=1396 RepID=UPI000B4A8F1D|nr:hypothetical protein [Bacillus cereus]EKS8379612.1 hypothetical protein [Bacillus cereus]EKS8384701.1 hypothetical protein [Bacillus cereus]EMA7399726.1 hypothetical protein [Bacillus cereus]EMA7401307.1 hypothetical protein [Bacillus cereus]